MKNLIRIFGALLFLLPVISESLLAAGVHSKQGTTDIIYIKDDGLPGSSLLYDDIAALGYPIDVTIPDSATESRLNEYSMVVLSTGNNPFACQSMTMRLAVQSYIINGGKVLIEGGQTGYIAAVFPYYLGFRNKVLKITDWITNNGGNLVITPSHALSALALEPNILSQTINITYGGEYDQDVCTNDEFSELFYATSLYDNKVGILVAPSVSSPQVINMFVYYSSISERTQAKHLISNCIYNLIGSPVGINSNPELIPLNINLYQNYPNPFNPGTLIKYETPNNAFVTLAIYNELGTEIEKLVYGKQGAGKYEVSWNARNYSSGVYYYSLYINGNLSAARKMLLLK